MNDEMRPNPVPRFIHDGVLRELAEARECLREAIDEVEWYESKTGGRTGLSHIKKWRNAAGLGATSLARAIIDAGVYDATEGTENNQ